MDSFDPEKELIPFLHLVLDKAEQALLGENIPNSLQIQAAVDQTVGLLRYLADNDSEFKEQWKSLANSYYDIYQCLQEKHFHLKSKPTATAQLALTSSQIGGVGRPSYQIPQEMLENLKGLGFTWKKIAEMLGVSRWTINRRVKEFGLQSMCKFKCISDRDLDHIICQYMNEKGKTTGQTYIMGYSALRLGAVVRRRSYQVPWPKSLWHLDGHHSLTVGNGRPLVLLMDICVLHRKFYDDDDV